MIKFKRVIIENYKSIDNIILEFKSGIFKVVGKNLDGLYASNGSGKTSVLQALFVGLWNSDPQGIAIGEINNRITKKPCKIQIEFQVVDTTGTVSYTVINDKKDKKHYLYKNGKLISQQYKTTTIYLMELFNLSPLTFKFLHYITTNSILELTYNLSNSVIFNEILQVTQLRKIKDNINALRKELSKEITQLAKEVGAIEQRESLLTTVKDVGVQVISNRLGFLKEQLSKLYEQRELELKAPLEAITNLTDDISKLKHTINDKRRIVKSSKCPTCGSLLDDPETIDKITKEVRELSEEKSQKEAERESQEILVSTIKASYSKQILPLESEKQNLEGTLAVQEELQKMVGRLPTEDFEKVKANLKQLKRDYDILEKTEKLIKDGEVFEDLLSSFFEVVQTQVEIYKGIVRFPYSVLVVPEKQAMRVVLKDDKQTIPLESLSNGERARLSLLLLVSLITAIQQISGSHTNFIVFDEATSSFDESGIKELRDLFQHLKELGVSCFIITHGKELDAVEYDGELVVTKSGGLSTGSLIVY